MRLRPSEPGARDRRLSAVASSLARSVRGGASLVDSLAEAAHGPAAVGTELQVDLIDVVSDVDRGGTVDGALSRWQDRSSDTSIGVLVAACRFGHAHGGDLASVLDGAALTLLDRAESAEEASALAAQARSSAGVLVALPLVGAAGFSVIDPAVAATILTTVPGRVCLVAGLALDALGLLVIARLVRWTLA